MATPVFLWMLLAWGSIFHPLTLFVFAALMCLLKAAYNWVLFPNPTCYSVCLFIDEFSPFTLRVIIDVGGFTTAILSFVFW